MQHLTAAAGDLHTQCMIAITGHSEFQMDQRQPQPSRRNAGWNKNEDLHSQPSPRVAGYIGRGLAPSLDLRSTIQPTLSSIQSTPLSQPNSHLSKDQSHQNAIHQPPRPHRRYRRNRRSVQGVARSHQRYQVVQDRRQVEGRLDWRKDF